MIARRAVLAGSGLALAALASPLRAQQGRRLPTVAFVLGTAPEAALAGSNPPIGFVRSFLQALREAGFEDGQTITLERRSAEGVPGKAAAIFADLAARRVDVIVCGGERWLIDAALAATNDIPIVANLVFDPVAAGLIASFARPGGNLTGVTRAATGATFDDKALHLLREMQPAIRNVAIIAGPLSVRQFLALPRPAGIGIVPVEIDSLAQLESALASRMLAEVDGLIVGPDGPVFFGAQRIAAFAAERRIPAIYGFIEVVAAGGLMAYAAGGNGRFRQMAKLAARFLTGARIGEVPVEHPTSFDLVINAKAAAALGLKVPTALLAQADEVIE